MNTLTTWLHLYLSIKICFNSNNSAVLHIMTNAWCKKLVTFTTIITLSICIYIFTSCHAMLWIPTSLKAPHDLQHVYKSEFMFTLQQFEFHPVFFLGYGQNLFASFIIFHASAIHCAIQYDWQQNNSTSMRIYNFCNAVPYVLVEI